VWRSRPTNLLTDQRQQLKDKMLLQEKKVY